MKRRWPRCVVVLLSLLLPAPSITASQEAPLASESGGTQSFIVVAGRLSITSPGPYTVTAIEMTIPPGAAALTGNPSEAVLLFVRSGSLIIQYSGNAIAREVVRLETGERLVLRNRHHLLVQNTNTLPARVVVVSLTAPAVTRKLSDVASKGGQ